jgi:O-antigen/teichoic acid export membrane protein
VRGLFWAAVAVGCVRVIALYVLIARKVLPTARPERRLLGAQLAFALPFAGATWLYVGQRYFAQYAVSAHFSAATFALFTVASFHMPVVDIVFTPITEVLMVELGRKLDRAAWDDAVDKLASLLFPATCGAWLFGPTVLPLLFTQKYAAAVPLFVLATAEIPLSILPCDALLRAAGDTRFLFAFNGARIALTAACVVGGIHFFGLEGAIAGGITSEALARVGMLVRGKRFLRVRFAQILDWHTLSRIALAAALACVPAYLIAHSRLPTGMRLSVGGIGYAAVYFALRAWFLRGKEPAEPVARAAVSD